MSVFGWVRHPSLGKFVRGERIEIDWRMPFALLSALIGCVVLLVIWRAIQSEQRLTLIGSDPLSTVGHWTEAHCSLKNGWTEFRFTANGKTYVGEGDSDKNFCRFIKVGSQVDVTYYNKDPSINFAGKTVDLAKAKRGVIEEGVAITLFFLGIVLSFGWLGLRSRCALGLNDKPAETST